jgi:hypothetical protein
VSGGRLASTRRRCQRIHALVSRVGLHDRCLTFGTLGPLFGRSSPPLLLAGGALWSTSASLSARLVVVVAAALTLDCGRSGFGGLSRALQLLVVRVVAFDNRRLLRSSARSLVVVCHHSEEEPVVRAESLSVQYIGESES